MNKDDKEAWGSYWDKLTSTSIGILDQEFELNSDFYHNFGEACFLAGRESLKQEIADYREALNIVATCDHSKKCRTCAGLSQEVLDKYKQRKEDE